MEILIADTAMQIKSRYILTFVDVASPYYHDYIEKHTTFSDGLCYTGYLWDCFRNKVPMSEDACIRFIKRQKTIYCFWDIHSKDRILVGVGSFQPYFVGNNGPFFVGKLGANQ